MSILPPPRRFNVEEYYPAQSGKRTLLEAAPIIESRPVKKARMHNSSNPEPRAARSHMIGVHTILNSAKKDRTQPTSLLKHITISKDNTANRNERNSASFAFLGSKLMTHHCTSLKTETIQGVPAPSVAQQKPVPAPTPASNNTDTPQPPPVKKSIIPPWTPAEELRLKQMRDAGNSWAEIAKTFPTRTEGSVKKHWYKDMHYAEFAEDESQALLNAIKVYENNKWMTISQKVGKPAKACEQYAKEHFPGYI
ncbi:hypothetical protein F4679DRAFT_87284 [Xylaria curta]|nr:hypothetical protein F4679DRAFT_87284 [Xylaria curta]